MSQESELLLACAELLEHAARLLPGVRDPDLLAKRNACLPMAAKLRARAAEAAAKLVPEPVALTAFQKSAPERVWINVFGTEDDYPDGFPANHEDITWAEDEVGDLDIPYIRADLACPAPEVTRDAEPAYTACWNHGCNALCTEIDLWVNRCPHCGRPAPQAVMQEPKP